MTRTLLNQAEQIARKEIWAHPEFKFYLHWSFIIIGNKIFVHSTNRRESPPKQFGYHSVAKLHSELAAYRKCYPKGEWEIINIRLNRKGEFRNSCPCSICSSWLKELGCKKVLFTTESGWAQINWR